MAVDELTLEQLTQKQGMRAEVDKSLNKIVKKVMNRIETKAIRVAVYEALKHLLIVGNVLIYLPGAGGIRVYRLDKYVVKRDPSGAVLEIIVKESRARDTLPENVRKLIAGTEVPSVEDGPKGAPSGSVVDIYTHVYLDNNVYRTYQEIEGVEVPRSRGSFPVDRTPWIALRGVKIDGEDYGRSHVEEYSGDLTSLEKLSKAINEGAAIASLIKFFVRPGGLTKASSVSKTPNGGFVTGDIRDISVLQLDKYADLRIVRERAGDLEKRLSYVFLLNSAIQRPGERVTAEEIRYMAQEIEDTLGGLYSLMSQELQLPFTRCLLHQLEESGELPELPKEIQPSIVTGLDAIGRGQDHNKLNMFIQTIAPTPAAKYVNWGDFATRQGNALGIDMDGLILSEEEVQEREQQAQMMAMAEKLGPNAINQLGGMAQKGVENSSE